MTGAVVAFQSDLAGLRLRLARRALWLRRQWSQETAYHGLVITDAEAERLLRVGIADELRFQREDPEAAAMTRALREGREPSPLDELASRFGLDRFERDVVVLCLAPELYPGLDRLYAYLQDDVSRRCPTPALTIALLAEDEGSLVDLRARFAPAAPLLFHRLVRLEPQAGCPTVSRPLVLEDRVLDHLLGRKRLEPRLAPYLRPLSRPAALTPKHRELARRLARQPEWRAGGQAPVLNLRGAHGSGRSSLAAEICALAGLTLQALQPAPGQDAEELLALLCREARLQPLAVYLDLDLLQADPLAQAVLERLEAPLLTAGVFPSRSERRFHAVAVNRPNEQEQVELWRQLLRLKKGREPWLGELVHQFDFGSGAIERAVAAVAFHQPERGGRPSLASLWRACKDEASRPASGLVEPIPHGPGWEDLVLPDDAVRQLREIVGQVAQRARVYTEWGFGARLARGRGIAALFAGPSGTGKTMAAEVLAGELDLDLYAIDLASVVSKYIGETEKNLRSVFEAAERSGAILFFDEADALFGKRSEVRDSHDRYANIEINYLLQRMEQYHGLAVLATNRRDFLDEAFLRRLRFLIDFPFPDLEMRSRIWRRVFPPEAPLDGIDFDDLARLEITGGSIRNIAVSAAFLAAQEGGPIRLAHVLQAARREYAKIDRLVLEGEFGPHFLAVSR